MFRTFLSLCIVLGLVQGCGGGSGNPFVPDFDLDLDDLDTPLQIEIGNPLFTTPPSIGSPQLRAQTFDLADVGFVEQEYFVEGTAISFRNVNQLLADGIWETEPAEEASFRVRIVVHKPADPDTPLNGGIVVEWLDQSTGSELPLCWGLGHSEMYRDGTVWIGVSAQAAGIERLKELDPDRYARLTHPGDSFSYDIFAQIARGLGNPDGVDPLDGKLRGSRDACGHSGAADRLVTYVNGVEPLYLSSGIGGLIIVSRSSNGAPLSQPPQADIPVPDATRLRSDGRKPVLNLQTETDLTQRGSDAARQDDSQIYRLWEVAGTANLDYYSIEAGRADTTGLPEFAAVVEQASLDQFADCDLPVNSGPYRSAFNRALEEMSVWSGGGATPRAADRLQLDAQGDLVLDSNGNASGGLRTPHLDAPTAVLSGAGNSGDPRCDRLGTTALFTADRMASLYVDQAGYVQAVTEATNAAVAARFLSPQDADAIIEWAPSQWSNQVD